MAARTCEKSMRYFCGAAAFCLIVPPDLSIPPNSDICGKSALQKKTTCNALSGLNAVLILLSAFPFFSFSSDPQYLHLHLHPFSSASFCGALTEIKVKINNEMPITEPRHQEESENKPANLIN